MIITAKTNVDYEILSEEEEGEYLEAFCSLLDELKAIRSSL